MAKISQYPVITSLTGQELVLMDSGPAATRQTVTATTNTLARSIAQGVGQFTSTASGVVPASGGGTATALRADGQWSSTFTGSWVFSTVSITGLTTGTLTVGTNPASTGAIRLANTGLVTSRNAANSADIQALQVDANNRVRIAPGGSDDIVWGRSAITLGGGASATLGTIGGSGPATATQFEWLKVFDTSGNACFIPIWK